MHPNSALYATGITKISGNFHSLPGSRLKVKYREFYSTDDRGCKDLCTPYLPNVFTPNGDGINDIYTITAPNGTYYKFTAFEDGYQIYYKEDYIYSNRPVNVWDGSGIRHSYGVINVHLELNDCPHGSVYSNNYFFQYYTSTAKSALIAEIQNQSEKEIEVFPNPSSGIVYIQVPQNFQLPLEIELIDLKGAVLIKKSYNSNAIIFDLSNFVKGAYIIKIINQEKNVIKKVVLQ